MIFEFWVALKAEDGRYGWQQAGVPKVSRNKPTSVGKDTIPVRVEIDVPTSYFEEPQFSFKAELPEPKKRAMLNTKMQDNIAQAIEESLGVKVHLSVESDDDEDA